MTKIILLIGLLISSNVYSITPLNGVYWNPNESGRGFTFDFQNGILVVTAYIYQENGTPIWYLAAGPMTFNNTRFTGVFDEFANGQCITCDFVAPDIVGNAGQVSIQFSRPDRATIVWQGRTIPVERQNFGFGEPPESMLGEWIFAYDIIITFADRYRFTIVGPPSGLEGGTGLFFDSIRNAGGECFVSGVFAGECFVIDLDQDGDVSNRFIFTQLIDRVEGTRVSNITSTQFDMVGFQVLDASVTSLSVRSASKKQPNDKNEMRKQVQIQAYELDQPGEPISQELSSLMDALADRIRKY